jgi:hypothetical protein
LEVGETMSDPSQLNAPFATRPITTYEFDTWKVIVEPNVNFYINHKPSMWQRFCFKFLLRWRCEKIA